jgi:hypothetical protein
LKHAERTVSFLGYLLAAAVGLSGCSATASHDLTNGSTDPNAQQEASTTEAVQKLLTSYGWTLRAKEPAVQSEQLARSVWDSVYGEGPVWKFNETLSASVGYPFGNLVGQSVELWAYPVSRASQGANAAADTFAVVLIHDGKIHGVWLTVGGPFNVPGFPLSEKVPAEMVNFSQWLHKEGLLDTSTPPLNSLKGKSAAATVRMFFELGAKGNTLAAIQMVDPLHRWIDHSVDPKSYWEHLLSSHKARIKAIHLVSYATVPGVSVIDYAHYHKVSNVQNCQVTFVDGSSVFVRVVQESAEDPWLIQLVSNQPI